MVCGDITQVPKEIHLTFSIFQAVSAIPITAVLLWQFKILYRSVKSIFSRKKHN